MKEKFAFLTSTRFWAIVLGAVAVYFRENGTIGESEMMLINTILGGFIIVKTVDRASEKIGGAGN